jgi:ABC-type branched-subunit amino acid transport system ATPase component
VVSVVGPLRDRLATRLAVAVGIDAARAWNDVVAPEERPPHLDLRRWARPRATAAPSSVLLRARGLTKSFGGIRAVRGVSFDVRAGSIVGLIGPNGAGKTTTFEMVSGFTRPDGGAISFQQSDITHLAPEARGRLGLIRSFQDAALFPTMTVEETLALAHERVAPTRFFASALGSVGNDTRKRLRAGELVELMGLGAYRRKQVQELSTGTRRIVELACLMALEPSLLLLDEPSSGIAQRETEALGVLLRQLRDELGTTLLVIEHDIPLIMGLSDVVLAMAEGQLITSGTPEAVRNHPAVVESYLGTSSTAIDRSSHGAAPPPQRRAASAVAT